MYRLHILVLCALLSFTFAADGHSHAPSPSGPELPEEYECDAINVTGDNYQEEFEHLCEHYHELYHLVEEHDPCAEEHLDDHYNLGLHIGAVFIILAASFLGGAIPLFAARNSRMRITPYHITLGKCAGIGVILACALIHMLLPGQASLSSPCLPESFNGEEGYTAYSFLFAMLAAIVMHFMDFVVAEYMAHVVKKQVGDKCTTDTEMAKHDHKHEGHSHGGILLDPRIQKTITAYLLEFGVTVHSIFIGLTVGVADDDTLKALLVALVFHQFFEGIALGSRISEAKLPGGLFAEIMHISVFAVSAPLGIAIGIGVISSLNPNGVSFLVVQGVFDSICAGILLYIGFMLLLKDFPEDCVRVCDATETPIRHKAGMFIALWAGAALMAGLGKFL